MLDILMKWSAQQFLLMVNWWSLEERIESSGFGTSTTKSRSLNSSDIETLSQELLWIEKTINSTLFLKTVLLKSGTWERCNMSILTTAILETLWQSMLTPRTESSLVASIDKSFSGKSTKIKSCSTPTLDTLSIPLMLSTTNISWLDRLITLLIFGV